MSALPILYSFRRCPYAMRARMALAYAGIAVELREVLLRDKPQEMLAASPKGTVPVLVLPDGPVIDESVDIMLWALSRSDPDNWLAPPARGDAASWIGANDGDFKTWLDRYKYADRHPDHPPTWYRGQAAAHLARLDAVLADNRWLHGERRGLADAALFPFIRQFAMVDFAWFSGGPCSHLLRWLQAWLEDPLFLGVMHKYPRWQPGGAPQLLGPGETR
jgi:glutathione S-transferase